MANSEPQRPVRVFRMKNLRMSVWENTLEQNGQTTTRYSAKISKRYCDRHGNWHDTDTMFAGDLLRVAMLAQRAAQWMEFKEEAPIAGVGSDVA